MYGIKNGKIIVLKNKPIFWRPVKPLYCLQKNGKIVIFVKFTTARNVCFPSLSTSHIKKLGGLFPSSWYLSVSPSPLSFSPYLSCRPATTARGQSRPLSNFQFSDHLGPASLSPLGAVPGRDMLNDCQTDIIPQTLIEWEIIKGHFLTTAVSPNPNWWAKIKLM